MSRLPSASLLLTALALVACGDDADDANVQIDAALSDAAIDASQAIDAAPVIDAPDLRGPMTIELAGGANDLRWDAATNTLYFTNNDTNSLMQYTDAGGTATVIALPATPEGASLGGIVKRGGGGGGGGGGGNGGFLIARFGRGTAGGLHRVNSMATQASSVTGLDVARRRIGLAADSAGVIYDAYFTGGGGGAQVGGVSLVTVNGDAGTETEIAGSSTSAGFLKLVGLVATPDAVYVSQQSAVAAENKIFKITRPGNVVSTLATLPSTDVLALMPNGDLLSGGADLYRITPTGTVTSLFTDVETVRGMAFDAALGRIFFIEHSDTAGTPDKLHIRPLAN